MLPSSGYFRNITCPLHTRGDAHCTRPHCHFRHTQASAAPDPGPATVQAAPAMVSMGDGVVQTQIKHTYKPTPISELNSAGDREKDPKEEPLPKAGILSAVSSSSVAETAKRHIPVPYTPLRPEPRHLGAAVSRYRPSLPPLTAPPAYSPTTKGDKLETGTYLPGSVPRSTAPGVAYAPSSTTTIPGRFEYRPTPLEDTNVAEFSSDSEIEEPSEKRARIESEFDDSPPSATPTPTDEPKSERKKDERSVKSSKKPTNDSRSGREKIPPERGKSGDSSDRERRHRDTATSSKSSRGSERERESKSRKSKRSEDPKREKRDEKGRERDRGKSSRSKTADGKKKNGLSESEKKSSRTASATPENFESIEFLNSLVDELDVELSDSDEEGRTLECLKIFEEYVPEAPVAREEMTENIANDRADDGGVQTGKQRIARLSDRPSNGPKTKAQPDHKADAIRMVTERAAKIREFHGLNSARNALTLPGVGASTANRSSKVRIAHVSNVTTMLDSKKSIKKIVEERKATTLAQTIPKGQSRVAHVPSENFADRPTVLEPKSSQIPSHVRTYYLNLMIDECLKIYLTAEDAYERALQEELNACKKCKATPIYKNSAVVAISRLRKEIAESEGVKKNLHAKSNTISHKQVLIGKASEGGSWSIENKYKKVADDSSELKGLKFYENIIRWKLTEEQLQENGFPRSSPSNEKGKAVIYKRNEKQRPAEGNVRWCCRCKKRYTVDKKGLAVVKEECIYHPNNKYRYRGEVKYQCCGQDSLSDGCLSASSHVYEYVDYDNLRGYVKTLPKSGRSGGDYGVFALDCEMCYTTHGLDLTRVTVVDSDCKVIYETLVKPLYPIIDYNTRFSGLTEEQMKDVKTTLLDVQATFLHMFSDKTILVGHSLESDFKALKLIHNTIVDTSVLFPHKMGPPFKRALRNLTSEYLKKIIQNSVDGHDSAEDATVCMELIKWKLKEELKLR